jgi:hypothetical protein
LTGILTSTFSGVRRLIWGGRANPKEIAFEIVDELTAALNEFQTLAAELPDAPGDGS